MTTEQTTTTKPPKDARLVPLDLENESERNILHAQRLLCGWGDDRIPFWREQARLNNRSFFWVTLPAPAAPPSSPPTTLSRLHTSSSPSNNTSFSAPRPAILPPRADEPRPLLLVGHIALDRVDFHTPPDEALAAPDGSVLSLGSLFILPSHTGLRLGHFAMRACEDLARGARYGSLNCRAVTLTTLCEKYYTGGHMRGFYEGLGKEDPGRGNLGWYLRQGYVVFRTDVPRYVNDSGVGSWEFWDATFLRKELGGMGGVV